MKSIKSALLRLIAPVFQREASTVEIRNETPCVQVAQELEVAFRYANAVSYTHLTLPTICSV